MSRFVINGGNILSGKVRISGNKNSILPCMAASLLTGEEVTLSNVPEISDVDIFEKLLQVTGAEVSRDGDQIKIKAGNVASSSLPDELTSQIRASILLA